MIFYFTGTGNSRYIAKQIAAVTGETIVSINDKIKAGDTAPIETDGRVVFDLRMADPEDCGKLDPCGGI